MVAAVVATVGAYALMGVAGLWGVAFAAPVLFFAPSGRVGVREEPATPEAALAVWSRDGLG